MRMDRVWDFAASQSRLLCVFAHKHTDVIYRHFLEEFKVLCAEQGFFGVNLYVAVGFSNVGLEDANRPWH